MTDSHHEDHDHKSHRGTFIGVFLMLCALTAMSFWIANSSLMDNPIMGWSAMMAVSVCKALLVILFFMHLWWEKTWKYAMTFPALIMGVLLVLLLIPDVGNRTRSYSRERSLAGPEAVLPADMADHSASPSK